MLILPCWGLRAELQLVLLPRSLGQQEVRGRSIAVLLLGQRRLRMCEVVLIYSLKLSRFAPCKRFVTVLMHDLLWFVAGEANAMLVKARAKAEAIQLLAAALAQQVSDGSLGQPPLWCWHWRR